MWPQLLVKPSRGSIGKCAGKVIVLSPEELLGMDSVPVECVVLVRVDG